MDTAAATNPDFETLAGRINEALEMRGAWFFQVKENSQRKLVLLEIAPRIAGSMGLVRNQGVNLPLLSLYDAADLDVVISSNNFSMVSRL